MRGVSLWVPGGGLVTLVTAAWVTEARPAACGGSSPYRQHSPGLGQGTEPGDGILPAGAAAEASLVPGGPHFLLVPATVSVEPHRLEALG